MLGSCVHMPPLLLHTEPVFPSEVEVYLEPHPDDRGNNLNPSLSYPFGSLCQRDNQYPFVDRNQLVLP